ncbi:MAG: hypothetical protein KA784_06520, partial [Aquabacterium sp.]|nr:hypothetical protein [Aquabacterium sp.]
MIKIHSSRLSHRWLYLAAAGLSIAVIGYLFSLDRDAEAVATVEAQHVASHSPLGSAGALDAASVATPGMGTPTLQGEGDGEEDRSAALETGMEDWQKPENVALRAELQRWY